MGTFIAVWLILIAACFAILGLGLLIHWIVTVVPLGGPILAILGVTGFFAALITASVGGRV